MVHVVNILGFAHPQEKDVFLAQALEIGQVGFGKTIEDAVRMGGDLVVLALAEHRKEKTQLRPYTGPLQAMLTEGDKPFLELSETSYDIVVRCYDITSKINDNSLPEEFR